MLRACKVDDTDFVKCTNAQLEYT